ncbi:putative niacin/nicotinamide transporter NaiP [Sporosarcina sp. NCCP-2716]|uniref:MFS transporter n=1 Tax=Sporosarcina sp. NCCP-2716 TaxID=2943679 RepID=UPI00204102B7|nr:MFS transporter [Sporosarcina sp. NCCP-2716]GKV68314.1 putative niacin/nicotinamide transporter NaiP [Sporosarcina sp. NCCP-2716]
MANTLARVSTDTKEPRTISRNKLLFISGTGWMFDAMDVGILSFVVAAIAVEWNLTPAAIGWVGSVNSLGMMAGAILFGLLADRIGRKQVFMMTLVLFSLASGLSAFTTTLAAFLILRFFVGAGLGGELPVASTLVSESVEAKERGKVVVLLESFWAAGWLVAALIAYFVIPSFGWRAALIITALPAFYAIYLRRNLPDSPKFGQAGAPKQSVLQKMAALWAAPYRKRTLMLWIVWFTVVFSYYGMFLWLPSVMVLKGFAMIKTFGYVLLMTLAQLPGYFSAAWLIERTGRKFVLSVYLIGTALSALAFGNADTLPMLMLFGALLSFFNLGAWGALYAYSPEQYPTSIRGTGAGMAAGIGRIGGIFGPLLVGSLLTAGYGFGMIFGIFCGAILIGVLAVLFLGTETKQLELE